MNRQEVLNELIKAIYKVQGLSGEKHLDVDEKTIPIGNLPGFDSMRGVETTIELESSIGRKIGGDVNPFVTEDGKRALHLYEIVDRVYELIK